MPKDWRSKLNLGIENKLNKLLKRVKNHEEAYYSSRNPVLAQLWTAVAELQARIDILDRKISEVEGILEENQIKRKRRISQVLRKSLEEY